LGFQSAGIINDEIALKESGLEQYIDDMAEEKANQVTLGNNLLAQEQAMMQGQQGQGQQAEAQGPGIAGVQPINVQTGKSAVSSLPSGQPHATV
jgi:hypothetical protein